MRLRCAERLRSWVGSTYDSRMSRGGNGRRVGVQRVIQWSGAAGLALAVTGCGSVGPDEQPGTAFAASSPAASSAAPVDESAEPSPTPSVAGPQPTPAAVPPAPTVVASVAPSEQSTASRSVAPPAQVIQVTGVEVRTEDGVEQLVVSFSGGVPGWSARYVDYVRIDADPVVVEGEIALELVLESADPTGDQGLADEVAVSLLPQLDLVREVRYVYYLGDQITYAIGLAEQAEFSVETTGDALVFSFFP